MYGLSSASGKLLDITLEHSVDIELVSGRHNCLWCLITSNQLKIPLAQRGRMAERNLGLLHDDHQRFLSEVGGDLSKAKHYNNVIGEPILEIPLDNVGLLLTMKSVNY